MLHSGSKSIDEIGLPYAGVYETPKQPDRIYKTLRVTWKNICEIGDLGVGQFGQVILCKTVGLSLKRT